MKQEHWELSFHYMEQVKGDFIRRQWRQRMYLTFWFVSPLCSKCLTHNLVHSLKSVELFHNMAEYGQNKSNAVWFCVVGPENFLFIIGSLDVCFLPPYQLCYSIRSRNVTHCTPQSKRLISEWCKILVFSNMALIARTNRISNFMNASHYRMRPVFQKQISSHSHLSFNYLFFETNTYITIILWDRDAITLSG